MTDTGHSAATGPEAGAHPHPDYVKVWAILLVLLVVSVLGPMVGIFWVTLITAFAVAAIKALMVAAYFMHLNVERTYIKYLLFTVLILMLVLFAGVAPDVMKRAGTNWEHVAPTPGAPEPAKH
jgi:caa(3)-type oxidase subunit IV